MVLRLARFLISPVAAVIAFLVAILDAISHQIFSGTLLIGIPGLVLFFLAFYVAVLFVIRIGLGSSSIGPVLVGLIGATLVDVVLQAAEVDRALGLGWAAVHFALGYVTAFLVLRRFGGK